MAFLTAQEFKALLLAAPLDKLVHETIFGGEVYAFRDVPQALTTLKTHLVSRLHLLNPDNVVVVGSAKTGFSVAPDTFARQFSQDSDIDVVIVDEALFDACWITLVRWHYLRPNRMVSREFRWARDRIDDIYWGWLSPDRIKFESVSKSQALEPLRDLGTQWFNAFKSVGLYPEFATRNVNGRLYRTWAHALEYHVSGLRRIKERFSGSPE